MKKIAVQNSFTGKREGTKFVTLFQIGFDFFAEKSTVRVEFLDEDGQYLDYYDHEVIIDEFMLTGETREQRADDLLSSLGISR